MSLPNPRASDPATESSAAAPSDQKATLKEQIQQTQQKLQELENQLHVEEHAEKMKKVYRDSMHRGRLAGRVEDGIRKLEERLQMYKNIHFFIQEIGAANTPVPFARFTQKNIEALRELKALMDSDEKAMRENYPYEIYYNLHDMWIRSQM